MLMAWATVAAVLTKMAPAPLVTPVGATARLAAVSLRS